MSDALADDVVASKAAPVAEAQRVKLIDALRGVALLGILLMNIPGFAMADRFSEAFRYNLSDINYWFSTVIGVAFEGKMRALFGMIFGAGVLLFVAKKEDSGKPVTGLFYRRMFWLVLFGVFHAHVILWVGDILYLYGVCGMIIYLFRNVNPKWLVLGVPIVALLSFGSSTAIYSYIRSVRLEYVDAVKAQEAGQPLSEQQTKALASWPELEKSYIPNREIAKENTRKMKSDYATVAAHIRPLALDTQTILLPFELCDSIALMLLGMALYRWGFLTGQWSNASYLKMIAVGYGIGFPLVIGNLIYRFGMVPDVEAFIARMEQVPIEWSGLIYPFQRILLVLGHVSVLVLLYKGGYFQTLFRCLEAVGQMAFTNYIMHSVICTLVFFGYGLNQYAEWQYYQVILFAMAIWVVQLIISPLWLKYFLFGPLEWLWRSLTYWKVQPFRRTK